jgi:membrane AbrB-like protein
VELWIIIPVALVCGLLGALLGNRLGVPAGVLTGAIAGVGVALGLFGFPEVTVSPVFRQALQVLAGTMVGMRMTRESLRAGTRFAFPAAMIASAFIVSGVGSAFVASRVTRMDPQTALFAAMPGGMTEMSSVAASFGADGVSVAVIHMTRILVVTSLAGALVALIRRRKGVARTAVTAGPVEGAGEEGVSRRLGVALVFGAIGGAMGLLTGIPGGGIVGALAGSAATRLLSPGRVRTRWFQLGVQMVAGVLIGFGISEDFLHRLADLVWIAGLILFVQLLVWALMSFLLIRTTSRDEITILFSGAPGGFTELTASSGRLGADAVVVAFTHLIRLTTTVVLAPPLISLLLAG